MSIEETPNPDKARNKLVTTGSVIGAILASSCCIAPLILLTLGVSGAWIGNLTALEPYKFYFIAGTLVFLGLGFWQVYFKPKQACEVGSYCASPASGFLIKTLIAQVPLQGF